MYMYTCESLDSEIGWHTFTRTYTLEAAAGMCGQWLIHSVPRCARVVDSTGLVVYEVHP